MKIASLKVGPWSSLSIFAVVLAAGCSSTPEAPSQAKIVEEVKAQATVIAVDKPSRKITLERSDGTRMVVVAGPEVRNFDQIDPGEKLTGSYSTSLTARRLAADEADTKAEVQVAAARAKPGESPAAGIGAGLQVTVVVKSVDRENHIVTFTDPSGKLHAIEARRDEGKRFVAGLKTGDRVELIYDEILILSVE